MSSFALADNPTDAPVMSSDINTTSSQQKKNARHGRRNTDEKDESRPTNDRNKNAYKKHHQDAQNPTIGTVNN
jgi:hypothetical protein